MKQQLTIIGNRQSGKSYVLNMLALDAARKGDKVLYECEDRRTLACRFQELTNESERHVTRPVQIRRANGNESMLYESGGHIIMGARNSGGDLGRGINIDVHLMDNTNSEPHITAERVVRTTLRYQRKLL